jgi:RNA polymerase sigma-70 factor (ECF subfamily)
MDNGEAKSLISRIAEGDKRAFEAFYRAQSRSVFAFVMSRMNNRVEAEEVLSDTMFDLWKCAAKFKGESTVRTWVLGIARNKMLMHFRARSANCEDVDEFAEVLPDEGPDAISLIADMQRQRGVKRCMDSLSVSHRECLHLAFFESCSVDEIAAIQQVPNGTVKTRLHHARLKIKACLAELLRAEREYVAEHQS